MQLLAFTGKNEKGQVSVANVNVKKEEDAAKINDHSLLAFTGAKMVDKKKVSVVEPVKEPTAATKKEENPKPAQKVAQKPARPQTAAVKKSENVLQKDIVR